MNTSQPTGSLFSSLRALALGATLAALAYPAQAAVTPAQTPLFLTVGAPPNITVTLDDSGSMARAFTPDLCGNPNAICDNNPDSRLDHRYVKSPVYNPVYYDPTTIYNQPLDANGASLATSFTSAYINGFKTSSGIIDLSTNYRPSAGLFLNANTSNHEFMRHYASDVQCSNSDRCQYKDATGVWTNTPNTVDCDSDNDNNASEDNAFCQTQGMNPYYYVFDASNSGCNGTSTDNDCYDIKIVNSTSGADRDGNGTVSAAEADERQNFANWYSFFRTRNLMTVTAASRAMATVPATYRVAWQSLNSCRGSATSLVTNDCEGWKPRAPTSAMPSRNSLGRTKAIFTPGSSG